MLVLKISQKATAEDNYMVLQEVHNNGFSLQHSNRLLFLLLSSRSCCWLHSEAMLCRKWISLNPRKWSSSEMHVTTEPASMKSRRPFLSLTHWADRPPLLRTHALCGACRVTSERRRRDPVLLCCPATVWWVSHGYMVSASRVLGTSSILLIFSNHSEQCCKWWVNDKRFLTEVTAQPTSEKAISSTVTRV